MPIVKCKVIPEPVEGTRAGFVLEGTSKIRGPGNINFVCGRCKRVLIEGAYHGQFRNIVVHCPRCGSHNDIP